jgi:hypothetical protein
VSLSLFGCNSERHSLRPKNQSVHKRSRSAATTTAMFLSFRSHGKKARRSNACEPIDSRKDASHDRHAPCTKECTTDRMARTKSWQAFSKRFLLRSARKAKLEKQHAGKEINIEKRCSSKRPVEPKKLPPTAPQSVDTTSQDNEIPKYIVFDFTEERDEDDHVHDEPDYDFEESTYTSYRSILDDLSLSHYEDPYIDYLRSQASLHPDEIDDHAEIDIHTPLPSQAMHSSVSDLFKEMRHCSSASTPELEPCSSTSSDRTSARSFNAEQQSTPTFESTTASITDIHVDFLVETGEVEEETSTEFTPAFMVSQSSTLYSIVEIVDEIENIVNPFANDPAHYFSKSAKAAAEERAALRKLKEQPCSPMKQAAVGTTVASNSSTSAMEMSPQRAKMEALKRLSHSPIKSKHSLSEALAQAGMDNAIKPMNSPGSPFFFM